jgi:dTDP-4-amino-4,6-dideoxygalactose transaminase
MVIEDCAQAIGARQDDRLVGGQGRIGCFSFYPTKNLGAAGDGGLCVTRDATLAQRLRQLRVHGIERRYHHDLHGYNTRLDEIQAAVLRVKLPHVVRWNDQRRKIAERYLDGLSELPLEMPVTAPGNAHVWHVFAILCEGRQVRDDLQTYLAEQGVPTIIYYPVPLHLQRCYADQNWRAGDYPATESVASRILPLPMYPELTEAQVDHVIQSVQGFFKG